jgi:hypothetical protein
MTNLNDRFPNPRGPLSRVAVGLVATGPGLLTCLVFQAIWLLHPLEKHAELIQGKGLEPMSFSSWGWMTPLSFWPAWLMVASFFFLPGLLENILCNPSKPQSHFHFRLLEMGARLVGMPLALYLLHITLDSPARSVTGWTVFHYSLALFSSIVTEYRMQHRIPV